MDNFIGKKPSIIRKNKFIIQAFEYLNKYQQPIHFLSNTFDYLHLDNSKFIATKFAIKLLNKIAFYYKSISEYIEDIDYVELSFKSFNVDFLYFSIKDFEKSFITIGELPIMCVETPIGILFVSELISKNRIENRIFCHKTKVEDTLQYLCSLHFDNKKTIFKSCIEKKDGFNYLNITTFDPFINEKSHLAHEQIYLKLDKYIKANVKRSFIFYGQPGTGKTTLAYSIINHFKLKSLVIDKDTLLSIDAFDFFVNYLGIECVIIDDFDYFEKAERFLEILQFLNKNCKVVIGIVNSLKKIPAAVLRPGRFDEILKINTLDENIVKDILGSDLIKYFDQVKHFPIAYLNEFVIRSAFADHKNDINSVINELCERVERQSEELS